MSEEVTTTEPTGLEFSSYLEALPEGDRELYTKNGVDSFEKQTKWVKNLESALGKKGIIPPGENATDEEKAAFRDQVYGQLGRPEDGAYDFDLPEGSNQEAYSDEFLNELAGVAYENGMTTEGFQKLINTIAGAYNQQLAEWQKYVEDVNAKLGEDKMDDSSDNSVRPDPDSIHDEAKTKLFEANNLFREGKYKEAERMRAEANELYNKLETLR